MSILIPSSGCHTQSSPSERTPWQTGYVGARAKERAIHHRWYTSLRGWRLANLSPTTKLRRKMQHSSVLCGTSNELWKTIVRFPIWSLVRRYRCATYITNVVSISMQAMTKNVAPKHICQTRNMRWSVSKGRAVMTSSITSSMTKSLQKEY